MLKKQKETILNVTRKNNYTAYKGIMIQMTAEFSSEIMEARKHGTTFLKYWNKNNNKNHPKILHPTKISLKNGSEIKTFSDKTM